MFSFVISLMQLRLVKGIYIGCMLIQLQVMAMEMGYFKLSLLLQITHKIVYIWFKLLNLLLVWSTWGFNFFHTYMVYRKYPLITS
jgi:hypothetical protein